VRKILRAWRVYEQDYIYSLLENSNDCRSVLESTMSTLHIERDLSHIIVSDVVAHSRVSGRQGRFRGVDGIPKLLALGQQEYLDYLSTNMKLYVGYRNLGYDLNFLRRSFQGQWGDVYVTTLCIAMRSNEFTPLKNACAFFTFLNAMDYLCGKFADCSFSRFGFIVITDRQTDVDGRLPHATVVGVSNEKPCIISSKQL